MIKKTFIISVFIFVAYNLSAAASFTGIGYGQSAMEAKKEALAELSQALKVEVKSEFKTVTTVKNDTVDEMKTKIINLKSDLPILNPVYQQMHQKNGYKVTASLHSASSLNSYISELKRLSSLSDKNYSSYKKADTNTEKVNFLKALLTQIDQYYKYRIVAQLMGGGDFSELRITEASIKTALQSLENKVDSIDFGAKMIAKDIVGESIYIFPPTTANSSEVTQFGSAVKDHLAKYINTVTSPERAKYIISGGYKILTTGIELTCRLLDRNHNTLKTSMVFFIPSAYQGYTVEPVALGFEELLGSGMVVSSDFNVDIRTDKGRHDLLFKKGDTIRLLVKMNQPGYFYLVCHNLKLKKYSYIINFTDDPGNRKFIYYVGGDEVNKWIELGEFSVVPPFGVESLQVIASTEDLIDKVPDHYPDSKTGLYKLGEKTSETVDIVTLEKAVSKTRGLIKQKESGNAEAVLIFTTMDLRKS